LAIRGPAGSQSVLPTEAEQGVFAGAARPGLPFNNGEVIDTEVSVMRKLFLIGFLALLFAAPASAAKVVPIMMKDPCCHWFFVGGKYAVKYVSHGAVTIRNLDENTLKFVGPGGTRLEKVGGTITLKAKGTYHITMVAQAKDDNHLTLVVK